MNRLRPRTTVISGAALGLIAGAAVYGAVSSASASAPTSFKPALVGVATAPATAARCAAGQELEHGVCIVHVERPGERSGDTSSSSVQTQAREHDAAEAEHEGASEAAEHANEAAEHANDAAKDAAEHASVNAS